MVEHYVYHVQSLGFNSQQGDLGGGERTYQIKTQNEKENCNCIKKKKEKKIQSSSKQVLSHRGSYFEFF